MEVAYCILQISFPVLNIGCLCTISVITDYRMGFWASKTSVPADTVQYQLITGHKNDTDRCPDTMIRTPVLFIVLWSNKHDFCNYLKYIE